jgi:hypothetical protein
MWCWRAGDVSPLIRWQRKEPIRLASLHMSLSERLSVMWCWRAGDVSPLIRWQRKELIQSASLHDILVRTAFPVAAPASGGRKSPDQLAAERTYPISFVARCPCPNGFPCCGAIRGLTSTARLLGGAQSRCLESCIDKTRQTATLSALVRLPQVGMRGLERFHRSIMSAKVYAKCRIDALQNPVHS